MYFITIKRMLEVCFSAHPNIQYRAEIKKSIKRSRPAEKTGAAPFFTALRPQKDRRHSWQMGLMLL